MEQIRSNQNPLLRHIRKLQTSAAYRRAQGEFVGDGFKLLDEALKWCPRLKTVVVAEGCQLPPLPEGVRCVEVPAQLMQSLSSMKTPQGVVFTAAFPEQAPLSLSGGMLLLDRIQDPGNLGTILRTADAFSVPLVLTEDCADVFSEKTLRASMGAAFRSRVQIARREEILTACRTQGLPLAVTALSETAKDLRQVELKDYLVVIGSEGQGACREFLEAAQAHLIIPMQPRCESLNAGVAAAIVMWQMTDL